MLDIIRRDFSYTARSLRRAPTFSITVILILGLAIGLSSAMFTVFRAVLLERMPVVQQDRIVELSGIAGGAASEVPIEPAQLHRLRDQTRTLQAVAGMAHWRVVADVILDGDRRLSLRESVVTDGFFDALGARPVAGRLFRTGDGVPWGANTTGAGTSVVLSHAAWMRYFGGDPSVMGRSIRSPKLSWTMTIIGVAPPGLDYPRGVEFWIAADYGSLDVVARLASNTTAEMARQEFQAFLTHDPDVDKYLGGAALGAQVHTLTQMVTGGALGVLLARVLLDALVRLAPAACRARISSPWRERLWSTAPPLRP